MWGSGRLSAAGLVFLLNRRVPLSPQSGRMEFNWISELAGDELSPRVSNGISEKLSVLSLDNNSTYFLCCRWLSCLRQRLIWSETKFHVVENKDTQTGGTFSRWNTRDKNSSSTILPSQKVRALSPPGCESEGKRTVRGLYLLPSCSVIYSSSMVNSELMCSELYTCYIVYAR